MRTSVTGFLAINPTAENIDELSEDLISWLSGPSTVEYLGETISGRHYQAVASLVQKRFMRLRVVETGP